MKICAACFGLESSTFTPVVAAKDQLTIKYADFVPSAVAEVLKAEQHQMVSVMLVSGSPSGVVPLSDFVQLSDEFLQRLEQEAPFDGLLLFMHGSMLVSDGSHGELEILRRIRARFGLKLPISVRLDLHGNIPDGFVEQASVITALRTAPHRDGLQTAQRAARLLCKLLREKITPCNVIKRLPLLFPGELVTTDQEPAASLYRMIDEVEKDADILSASITAQRSRNQKKRTQFLSFAATLRLLLSLRGFRLPPEVTLPKKILLKKQESTGQCHGGLCLGRCVLGRSKYYYLSYGCQ